MAKNDILSILPAVANLSRNEAIEAADLNWQVQSESLGGLDTGRKATGRKGLFTSDDRFLGDVGNGYVPSDPAEFVSSLYDLADFAGFPVSRLSFLESRSQMVGLIDMKPIDINGNDRVNVGIVVRDGFDGFTSRSYTAMTIRERCLNGMVSKKIIEKASAKHSKSFDLKNEELFKLVTGKLDGWIQALENKFGKLANRKIGVNEVENVMETLFPLKDGERSTRSQNVVDDVLARFTHGIGNNGETAWDLYNAFTEYETHGKTYKQTENQTPDSNRFKAFVDGFSLSEKAMELLTA